MNFGNNERAREGEGRGREMHMNGASPAEPARHTDGAGLASSSGRGLVGAGLPNFRGLGVSNMVLNVPHEASQALFSLPQQQQQQQQLLLADLARMHGPAQVAMMMQAGIQQAQQADPPPLKDNSGTELNVLHLFPHHPQQQQQQQQQPALASPSVSASAQKRPRRASAR